VGARLIIQRAVEDEFDAWLGRARYEHREPEREERSEESGLRNGFRPRRVQTAEGELEIEIPQARQAAETFASKLFPRTPKLLRTEPLKALVIGAFVRGSSALASTRAVPRRTVTRIPMMWPAGAGGCRCVGSDLVSRPAVAGRLAVVG